MVFIASRFKFWDVNVLACMFLPSSDYAGALRILA